MMAAEEAARADGNRALSPEEIKELEKSRRSTADIATEQMFVGGVSNAVPEDHARNAGHVIRTAMPVAQRERIEREINGVMADVIADARRSSPTSYPGFLPPPKENVARSPVAVRGGGTGWEAARPLEVPGGARTQAVIEAMTHAFEPHGPANPEYRGPAAQSALAKAVAAARAAEPKAAQAAPVSVASEVAEAVPEAAAKPEVAAANAPEAKVVAGTVTRRRLA
jgi:hypothetical protein